MKTAFIGILLFLLILAGLFVAGYYIGNWFAWQERKKKSNEN